jgi:DNA-binding beta-propeller fold protein YncE
MMGSAEAGGWRSPTALAVSPDGQRLFVAAATGAAIIEVDPVRGRVVRELSLPTNPTGLTASRNGRWLWVTCATPVGRVCRLDLATDRVVAQFPVGHTPMSPVLSPDESRLYVCLRFRGEVVALDPQEGRVLQQVAVAREPWSADLTSDGRWLLVAHHLPDGCSSDDRVAASISVVDTTTGQVARELMLPNGSTLLRELRVAPNGRWAAVVHSVARFQLPTTQLDRGWMNTSAVTFMALDPPAVINTVLLDEVDRGAANPWGVAWTADSRRLLVTHAGTHELSVIDVPGLLAKLAKLPAERPRDRPSTYLSASASARDVPNDLAFLVGLRVRVKLQGKGPRAVTVIGERAWVADYFTDTLETVKLTSPPEVPRVISLGPTPELTRERRGERLFNDATIGFQQWQSCASCHSEDARTDGLNWDLLNDGLGNPKNTKSLVFAHGTPPAMSLGVREDAVAAVRAGLRHILFAVRPEAEAEALDAWLSSLRPLPSPFLVKGELSPAARRGRKLFASERVGCAFCHPLQHHFSDGQRHDVGTAGPLDGDRSRFDTPTLVELWRTGPYLHDGSALTLREVLVDRNPEDRHGVVSALTAEEITDLIAYLNSL